MFRTDNTLHVIAVISNPQRYSSRYRLYRQFAAHMATFPTVRLHTVEHAFGDRVAEITGATLVRGHDEVWLKENLINIGLRHLPTDWRYVAWIDADVFFLNPDWATETLHALQHYQIVQPYESAVDLGPHRNHLKSYYSFARQYVMGAPPYVTTLKSYSGTKKVVGDYWHPGFAWAARREFINNVGGLIDFAIVGAGDHHMALSLVGKAALSLPAGINPNYTRRVMDWQVRAVHAARGNLGFVRGSLLHSWHGPKSRRKYVERWDIVVKNNYDPDTDIAYDEQGLIYLTCPHKTKLRDQLRAYFRERDEDSVQEDL
jgi:hypothetical protein